MNIEKEEGGLQCDNPKCDWKDTTIKDSDLEQHLNALCPKCGENILTEEDYNSFLKLQEIIDFVNSLTEEEKEQLTGVTYENLAKQKKYKMTVNTHKGLSVDSIEEIEDEN